jgi:acetoacetate decarboxylase
MGVRGTLTKGKFGYSMPVQAPLYPSPPFLYRDASLIFFEYVTDPRIAATIVPEELELADPPTALVAFASYPWSSLGAYLEVVQILNVLYKGKPTRYAVHLYVTTDQAMGAGREVGGYPKKLAKIAFQYDTAFQGRVERPDGLTLATGVMRPEEKLPLAFPITNDYLCLRLIPSPIANAQPTVCELLTSRWVLLSGEMWRGPGTCVLTGASALDPLHLVPIVEPVASLYFRGDFEVSPSLPGDETPI